MRAVITGGAGFLGSHLCDIFIEKGWEVLCLDNLVTGADSNVAHLLSHPRFKFAKQDVSQYIDVPGPVDAVLHFASPASPPDYLKFPIQTLKVGALGTHNTLGLAMAKQAKLDKPKPRAQHGMLSGRGVSYLQYENTLAYVAAEAEVQVDPTTGVVSVTRVVVAHDCGQIINPDGLTNQIEGNVIQSVSRTLKEEVQYDANGVTSVVWAQNQYFPNPDQAYPILHFSEVPDVEVVLIDQPNAAPWGAGEPVTEVIPAAIGNAVFDATGARLRSIPFTPDRVLAALAALGHS